MTRRGEGERSVTGSRSPGLGRSLETLPPFRVGDTGGCAAGLTLEADGAFEAPSVREHVDVGKHVVRVFVLGTLRDLREPLDRRVLVA